MYFETFKALHLIFMVSWFAGLFYIVRLYIYHVEATKKSHVEATVLKEQFKIMESKLWWIITTPAMTLTIVFGVAMLIDRPAYLQMPWMHLKLTFLFLLVIYHFLCQRIFFQLKKDVFKWTSNQLRLWNELATLFLVAIVFIVVFKGGFSWVKGTIGFFGVAILLMIGIKMYKRFRKN